MLEALYRTLNHQLPLSLILVLLIAHMVGDFILQSDWMALNKGKRWDALSLHVGVYIAVVSLIIAAFQPPSPYPYAELWQFGGWVLVNGVAHFVTDAITSRVTSRLWFLPQVGQGMRPTWIQVEVKDTRHWFFVAIGADQLLHYIVLFTTAQWWLR